MLVNNQSLAGDPVCAPGVFCSDTIIVQLLDSFGNTMTLDDSSIATMSAIEKNYSTQAFQNQLLKAEYFYFKTTS